LKVFYSPRYCIDIGLHVFPTLKYRLVRDRLVEAGTIEASDVIDPAPATWEELALVHTSGYLARMREGTLSADELAQLELPWSADMVDGFRLMVGGTIGAARLACAERTAVCHIGGGLHHAFANHGEGFCPFNDVAVAVRVVQAEGVDRIAVIDLDVHHGNGTSFIFNHGGAPPPPPARSGRSPRAYSEQDVGVGSVFTFSMHQQLNYPMWKPRSSLDVGLANGVRDATYLQKLEDALPIVLAQQPQCVFYLAGADPYEDDQLGGLRLTVDGLRRRDRMVFDAVHAAGVPLVVTLAGGYARRIEDTVAIHVATIEEARRVFR